MKIAQRVEIVETLRFDLNDLTLEQLDILHDALNMLYTFAKETYDLERREIYFGLSNDIEYIITETERKIKEMSK